MAIERPKTPNFDRGLHRERQRRTITRLRLSQLLHRKPAWFWFLIERPMLVADLMSDALSIANDNTTPTE